MLVRVAALALVAAAVYLVVMRPTASVASATLLTKVNVEVQCSSVWNQWTHHAKPATLVLNGQALTTMPTAQRSCASASTTIKRIASGAGVGGVVVAALSLLRRPTAGRRAAAPPNAMQTW